MNSRRAQGKHRSAFARCEHCQRGLAFGEVARCFAQRGRLTYPRATADGRREETAYDWLCGECRARGDEHRRRGKVSPGAVNIRGTDSLFSRAVIFSTGLATGILVMGIIDQPRREGHVPDQATNPAPASLQANQPLPPVAIAAAPAARKPSITVDNLRPRVGRGIRITLRLPTELAATATPYLKLKDVRGGAYRSEMQAGQDAGEWFWASGLDVPGVWRGEAHAQAGDKQLTVKLPRIDVSP